jgi:uncharacterized protein DUF6893
MSGLVVLLVVIGVTLLLVLGVVLRQLPELRRYLKIRSM